MDRLAQVRHRPGPGRAHGPRPQRRGGRLPADRGVVPRAEAPQPEERGVPDWPGAQRRHRAGLDARDAAADGDAVRGHRERRQAVAAADRRPGRVARRAGAGGVPAARAARDLRVAREPGLRAPGPRGRRQRAQGDGLQGAARRTSRWRARPARRRCTGAATTGVGGYEAATHAWFVGFAPAGRPRIALAVLVEHGGHGGDVAAPVAMEIVDKLLRAGRARRSRGAPHLGLPRRQQEPRRGAGAGRRAHRSPPPRTAPAP